MRFSSLTCVALAGATLLQPVISSNLRVEPTTPSFQVEPSAPTFQVDESVLVKETLFAASEGGSSIISGTSFDWSAPARWLSDLWHSIFPWTFWDMITELGPKFQGHADGLFHYAMEVYPTEKIMMFKSSMNSVTSTVTTLQQVVREAAEQRGVSLDSMKEELGDIFNAVFEVLKEEFPPPEDAPSHEKRVAMFSTALDSVEEGFLQFAIRHGVKEGPLKSHTNSLKFHVQFLVVTVGDLFEQHQELAISLLIAAIVMLLPELFILRQVLRIFGFGSRGPIKGGAAAWLQGWLFGPAVPKGGWFAMLQHLAMKAVKL